MAGPSTISPVYMREWWLTRVQGDGIAVRGIAVTRGDVQSFFTSASIIRRHDICTLEASDGCIIVISGFINRFKTQESGLPSEVCTHFLNGFPYYWEDYISRCFKEGTSERGRSILSLPAFLQDTSVRGVRELLISIHRQDRDGILGKQLTNDLITSLRTMADDNSVQDASPMISKKVAFEQDSNDVVGDIAVADKSEERGEDSCKANMTRPQRISCRSKINSSAHASTQVNDGTSNDVNRTLGNDKTALIKNRRNTQIPSRRSSRLVSCNLPSDLRECENAPESSFEMSCRKRKQVQVGSKVTLSALLDVTETAGSSREGCNHGLASPLERLGTPMRSVEAGNSSRFNMSPNILSGKKAWTSFSCQDAAKHPGLKISSKGIDVHSHSINGKILRARRIRRSSRLRRETDKAGCEEELNHPSDSCSKEGLLGDANPYSETGVTQKCTRERKSRKCSSNDEDVNIVLSKDTDPVCVEKLRHPSDSCSKEGLLGDAIPCSETGVTQKCTRERKSRKCLSNGEDVNIVMSKDVDPVCVEKLSRSTVSCSKKGISRDANPCSVTDMKRTFTGKRKAKMSLPNVEDVNGASKEATSFPQFVTPLRRSIRVKKPVDRYV